MYEEIDDEETSHPDSSQGESVLIVMMKKPVIQVVERRKCADRY